jgi:hypothetical protein
MLARRSYNGHTRNLRFLTCVIALAGCDSVLGVEPLRLPDGAAPAFCPALGSRQPPVFSPTVTRLASNCDHYVISRAADLAMAGCGAQPTLIEQGPVDGALASAMLPTTSTADLQQPRLFPEGNELYVRRYDTAAGTFFELDDYVLGVTGAWALVGPIAFPLTGVTPAKDDEITVPTATTPRRIIYTSTGVGMTAFHELVQSGTAWQEVPGGAYTAALAGLASLGHANLTSDGLHLVFTGQPVTGPGGLYIADRMDVTASFGSAVLITSVVPTVTDAYLADDCSVLYYAISNTLGVYRVQQQ